MSLWKPQEHSDRPERVCGNHRSIPIDPNGSVEITAVPEGDGPTLLPCGAFGKGKGRVIPCYCVLPPEADSELLRERNGRLERTNF